MFKNAVIYKIQAAGKAADPLLATLLEGAAFVPCAPTQPVSVGWVPPRNQDNGLLVEHIDGQIILKLMTETKIIPADAVERKLDEACRAVETSTGRKPGKKHRKELKEEVIHGLLPTALTRRAAVTVWLDLARGLVFVDTTSQTRADDAASMLVRSIEGLAMGVFSTIESPQSWMTRMLRATDTSVDFSVDRDCELRASDESGAVVRYQNHDLFIGEIAEHIDAGKLPVRLALCYVERVSFVLTETCALRKIHILDTAYIDTRTKDDDFDADVAIATGQIGLLIDELVLDLGGEVPIATP